MSDASGSRTPPSATGTLAATPFANVLVYSRNKRLTGTLYLRAPDGVEAMLSFWHGHIARVQTNPPSFGVGEMRELAPVEQACRRVHALFVLPPATGFAFYDAVASVEEPEGLLETLSPVWRGLRDAPPLKTVSEILARYAASGLRIVNDGALQRIGVGPDEKRMVQALSACPLTLAQLYTVSNAKREAVELFVYLLLIAKCVEPVTISQPAMPAGATAPPPSGVRAPMQSRPSNPLIRMGSTPEIRMGSTPEIRMGSAPDSSRFQPPSAPPPSFRAPSMTSTPPPSATKPGAGPVQLGVDGIVARAKQVENEEMFELLGLPSGAAVEVVRVAYVRLAKLWHPDRLPSDLAPARTHVMTVFTHLTRAHDTLTNEATRRAYLAARGAAAAKLGNRERTAVLRDIDEALARRDFMKAENEAKKLREVNTDDVEALAVIAWAASLAGQAPDAALRATLPIFDHVVSAHAECERAYFYRGTIHKRLGDRPAALRDFMTVVQLNPARADAEREVKALGNRAMPSGEVRIGLPVGSMKK